MPQTLEVDIIVAGGGASGVAAALQAARQGAQVLLVEETPWVGGMLTAAGVTALDGNDEIHSGIHREFVRALWDHCGGSEAVYTGWVSKTMYEPRVGQAILRRLIDAEPNITLWMETVIEGALTKGRCVEGIVTADGREARALITIDATEWGDVIALAGVPHRLGRDSREQTGEAHAPERPDGLIQDFTWVITAQMKGKEDALTYHPPEDYNPDCYDGCCLEAAKHPPEEYPHRVHTWESMISYGRCPGGLVMINWPLRGNDFFHEGLHSLSREGRELIFQRMKRFSLGHLHYIHTACGHPEITIAQGQYPTPDGLPLIPYVRESRRIRALCELRLDDVIDRYADPGRPLHRQGVAVGDYFIDHHHLAAQLRPDQRKALENEDFPEIQAVTVPLGCLIPETFDGLIAAEKNIGVTHIVNGVTRLQPIVMNIGQAAGALAALAARGGKQPREIDPVSVQDKLLDAGALLMPIADITPDDWGFREVQRAVTRGLMRPHDEPRLCRFHPNQVKLPDKTDPPIGVDYFDKQTFMTPEEEPGFTRIQLARAVATLAGASPTEPGEWFLERGWGEGWIDPGAFAPDTPVTRVQMAVALDRALPEPR